MAHNFMIENLGFHKIINDEHPYERATAPFRKDQIDLSSKVGDQSLTGWWTRGQLSFHMGEGLDYYEVLDGEEVLNRYDSSERVEVFTPGEARLDMAPASLNGDGNDVWHLVPHGRYNVAWCTYAGQAYTQRYPNDASSRKQLALPVGHVALRLASVDPYICAAVRRPSETPGWAIQRYQGTSGALDATVYTHNKNITGLWYLKDRLWVLDQEGNLFAVAWNPTGTLPVALADPVVKFGNGISTSESNLYNSLTDGGSAMYCTWGGRTVYALTLADDGSVPTLSAPVVVAETPVGENIVHIRAYLGLLVIATTKGVRFAAISGDGRLTYGPLVVEWADSDCRAIAAQGSRVVVSGKVYYPSDSPTFFEFDLSGAVGDNPLVPPYRVIDVFTKTGSVDFSYLHGAVEHSSWGYAFFAGSNLATTYSENLGCYESGWLETGWHRFGTLDLKRFHTVTIRTEGAGRLTVYQKDPSRTLTELGTIDVDLTPDVELPLLFGSPIEKMALRFEFERYQWDPWSTPIILGYQIKALPSPVRQRLIRVNLMMYDHERGPSGPALGSEKSAWTRLQALEALEEVDALVSYEDKETGETGTAFIESVELTRRNGTKGRSRSNGFGGVVTVTLRKVA